MLNIKKVVSLSLGAIILLSGCSANNANPDPKDNAPTTTASTLANLHFERMDREKGMESYNNAHALIGPSATAKNAAIVEKDNTITLVLFGSSSCPPTPDNISLADQKLEVLLKGPDINQMCTADLGPQVWKIDLPEKSDKPEETKIAKGEVLVPKVYTESPSIPASALTRSPLEIFWVS